MRFHAVLDFWEVAAVTPWTENNIRCVLKALSQFLQRFYGGQVSRVKRQIRK
jgi:hypothetical protein